MSDLEKSMANVVSAVGDIGKEIRKQAFLEAAEIVGNTRFYNATNEAFEIWQKRRETIVKLLREKAEECE